MVIVAMFAAMLNVTLGVRLQRTIPTKLLVRVESTLLTANQTSMPLGTVIFTFFYQIVPNSPAVLVVTGIVAIVYILVFLPFLYKNVKQDDKYLNDQEVKEAKL